MNLSLGDDEGYPSMKASTVLTSLIVALALTSAQAETAPPITPEKAKEELAYNSIKLYVSTGLSTRTGSNFTTGGIAWQYRWGGGL